MTYIGYSLSLESQALCAVAACSQPIEWEEMMELHRDALLHFAYSQTGDMDEAEDITQETFVQAHRSWLRYDRNLPLRPWLFGISTNVARSHRRSNARHFAAIQRLGMDPERLTTQLSDLYEQRWIAQMIWEALNRMEVTDRQVIILRHFMDLSIHETAERMNIAPGTVKSRMHRALARLRSLIEINFPALRETA